MQEEIGTGGGGFRFLYAAFLQEAADILRMPELGDVSNQMTRVGDQWRLFALACAKVVKGRRNASDMMDVAGKLRACMEEEQAVYRLLLHRL